MKDQKTNAVIQAVQQYSEDMEGKEADGNFLVVRDKDTNAMVPVVQQYSEDMEGKEADGNFLIVRDKDTNAKVPVVFGIGFSIPPDHSKLFYGIEKDITNPVSYWNRIGDFGLQKSLPIQNLMRGCLLDDNGNVTEYLPANSWIGCVRDGSAGQVMVEIPQFYYKFTLEGNMYRCYVSLYALPGYYLSKKKYVSAYEPTIQQSTGKLSSVINLSSDFRGGNNTAAWDNTYRSQLGYAVTTKSRTAFRNAARLRGGVQWNCNLYNAWEWLYMIEFANSNAQLLFNPKKDSNGFTQGGIGGGVTNLSSVDWSNYNSSNPIIPIGYTDSLGNGSGEVLFNLPTEFPGSVRSVYPNRYRGIENPFGHLWKWTDGINIEVKSDSDGGTSKLYICTEPDKFSDNSYAGYEFRGLVSRSEGYIKEMLLGEHGEIIAKSVGGSTTTFFCDIHYTSVVSSFLRGVLFGGTSLYGAYAGLGCAYSSNAPSYAAAYRFPPLLFNNVSEARKI